MLSPAEASPYSRAVVNAMRKLYPEALADKSFDNTGLLLEAPFDPLRRQMNSVLLTVDLTKAVADEAIERQDSIVIAYHPIIFRGLKSLTLGDTQQQSLLRLAAEGISVYSPHTAVDCARGGLGDWLADIVTGTPTDPSELDALNLGNHQHKRYPITKTLVEGYPGAGMGRIIRLAEPVPLIDIIDRIGLGMGQPKGFQLAVPQGKQASDISISSIALCAGSGGGLFSQAEKNGEDVDLYFTGELSHHEALAAIEKGKSVICLFHSNTERGFLHSVLKGQLEREVKKEWEKFRSKEKLRDGIREDYLEVLEDASSEIHVSEVDRDPYGIMISKAELK
ncbi:uncharacterized protein MYCFIDRAFT_46532 [Pseudocercospora fijiensis CIRAD86]|uniref:NGG1p interacting factor 3 n=1 Tax=Pseudocercospora fijiensis (strain CIRAD86) TaxID=383855 RepID=M3A897_PSEFD|nr:uncharacterized protein MYCFIDRAFT_46532 [Pseudocercospora fijiensis CIRAD86]EME80831.1 hypothetical protein MYCFIDRAFT_46532 [Pseudocercospora fijiensis CIRAD86]